jgi:Ca2+/Na+ antiporter
MTDLVHRLSKRRQNIFYILLGITLSALLIHTFFTIPITSYFGVEYNLYIVYGLICYKLIELFILYLIFYRRHLNKLLLNQESQELLEKFEKNGKRFFMLVPHGSTIFAIISYKLTANIFIFLLFMLIAFTTLFLVKPQKISEAVQA